MVLGIHDLPLDVVAALATSFLAALPFAATGPTHDDGRPRWWSALLAGAVIGSTMAYVLATLSPLSLLGDVQLPGSGEFPQSLNLVPVVDMLSTRPQFLLINLALLAPFGFLLRLRWPAFGLRGVALVSLALAVAIETAQLFHPLRGSNIDDVLLNVLGAVAAAALAMSIQQLGQRSADNPSAMKDQLQTAMAGGVATRTCSGCGSVWTTSGARWCGRCGAPLSDPSPDPDRSAGDPANSSSEQKTAHASTGEPLLKDIKKTLRGGGK